MQLYHAVSAAAALKECTFSVPNAKETVEAVLKQDTPTSHNIYLALAVADKLKLKVNHNGFAEALTTALTKDDGASRLLSISAKAYDMFVSSIDDSI